MSGKKKKSKKDSSGRDEEATKIYARVRGLMPWEPKKVSLAVEGAQKVRNKAGKITNEYNFQRVFKPSSTNEDAFKVIVMPMISNVLKGYNAVLIAYGQTGSGKTFSMLGKPKLGVVGLLPRMLAYMVEQPGVSRVELSAVEAFGHHVAKIHLYDLYDPHNQTPIWTDKNGDGNLDMMKANRVDISDAQDAHDKIVYAHAASHFAPTGKNPESSRGHVTFVATVHQQKSKHESQVSYFVFLDCAGSEGESAFTAEFKARVDAETLMARRLEAGTINTGLSELQVIFNQLRTKGKLTKTIGSGLRRVLHPYINTNTYLSVLFTLSPSVNNAKATESTLKFAVTAGMVKVKPVQTKGKINFEQLVAELKEHIERQEAMIEENNDRIEDLERQIARTKEAINRVKRGLPPKPKKKGKKGKKGKPDIKVSVEQVQQDYEPTGLTPPDFVTSPRVQAISIDSAAQESLMDVLDSSIMDLMGELDDEFKEELKKDGIQSHRKTDTLSAPPNPHAGKRGRTLSTEEVDEAMLQALKREKRLMGEKTPETYEKIKQKHLDLAKKREEELQEAIKAQEKQIKELRSMQDKLHDKSKLDGVNQEEIEAHALELNVLLQEQMAITKGLVQSKQVIVEYLKSDGREALLQFFKMRRLLD